MVHKPRTSIAQAIVAMYLSHLDLHVRITKFISGYSTGYTQEAHMVSKKLKNNLKYFFLTVYFIGHRIMLLSRPISLVLQWKVHCLPSLPDSSWTCTKHFLPINFRMLFLHIIIDYTFLIRQGVSKPSLWKKKCMHCSPGFTCNRSVSKAAYKTGDIKHYKHTKCLHLNRLH